MCVCVGVGVGVGVCVHGGGTVSGCLNSSYVHIISSVLSVFAPPVGNAENKADKQSKFR